MRTIDTPAPTSASRVTRPRTSRLKVREAIVPALLLVEIALFATSSRGFLTLSNISNVLLNSMDLALIASALTLVIILGGIDISTGPALGVIAWCVGRLTVAGWDPLSVIIIAVALGVVLGSVNGVLTSRLKVTAIIATLGTAAIWKTVLFALWGGNDLFAPPVAGFVAAGRTLGIPTITFFVLAAYLVLWYISRYRAFGRHVYAIGNDVEGARLSGINVTRTQIVAYALVGAMVGLASIVYMARVGVVQAASATDLSLSAIAAVVVGGTSITGGRGSLIGTLWGVLFIAVLQNGVVLTGVPPLWNGVLVGAFILLAVTADVLTNRISRRRKRS